MITMRHRWGLVGLLSCAACISPPARMPPDELGAYHERDGLVPPDEGRIDPWRRLSEIEQRYRGVAHNLKEHEDREAMWMPRTKDVRLSWAYVLAGRDFRGRGQLGAAARAFWAAIGHSATTLASRPSREAVRVAAYAGLAEIATKRDQPYWALLLQTCSNLALAYLSGKAAPRHHQDFATSYGTMWERYLRAEEAARRAADARARQAMAQNLNAQLNAIQNNVARVTSPTPAPNAQPDFQAMQQGIQDAARGIQQGVDDYLDLEAQREAADQAMESVLGKLGSDMASFQGVVSADIPAIEAGKSFVGELAVFYLASSPEPERFLPALLPLAAESPPIAEALVRYHQALAEAKSRIVAVEPNERAAQLRQALGEELIALGKSILALEVRVARFERWGLDMPEP